MSEHFINRQANGIYNLSDKPSFYSTKYVGDPEVVDLINEVERNYIEVQNYLRAHYMAAVRGEKEFPALPDALKPTKKVAASGTKKKVRKKAASS